MAPEVLTYRSRDVLIAATLGSLILRAPSKATSLADYERERQQAIKESNAKAVEILVRVQGVQEPEALHTVYVWLLTRHRAGSAGQAAAAALTPCDQIRDLLARFPQHREWSPKPECAPE